MNTENHKHKFTFSPTLEDKVLKLLKDTNPVKAAGTDNLSGRFLKYRAVVFEVSCSYFSFTNIKLCDLSMKRSKFPLDCKIAILKLLYKKGSKTDPKNYRPI